MLFYDNLVSALQSWEVAHPEILRAYDTANAVLEVTSVFMLLPTLWQACRTRLVVGIHWATPAFYCLWGYWNVLFWYPHLGQFWSWIGAAFIAIGNTVWVYMVLRFTPAGQFSFGGKLKPMHVEDDK